MSMVIQGATWQASRQKDIEAGKTVGHAEAPEKHGVGGGLRYVAGRTVDKRTKGVAKPGETNNSQDAQYV